MQSVTTTAAGLLKSAICTLLLLAATSCVNDDNSTDTVNITFANTLPEDASDATVKSSTIEMREINTGSVYIFSPMSNGTTNASAVVPTGLYDYSGTMTVEVTDINGATITKTLRTVGSSVTITQPSNIQLSWFWSNPESELIISEIYAAGSPNATATGGLRDSYIRIYNNSDHTVYADGLAFTESCFVNSRTNTYEILTPANNRNINFTVGTIWVIPGNGHDVPVEPGQSIKIADQAIDWNAQANGALDHTDADFEWWDDNAQDTDNPSVPNLEKWFCYSNTIWILSNQCNRSYALIRFPEGTTAEQYLANYHGGYDYISIIGTQMHQDKAYLIPNSWILDGVNLGNKETYVYGALADNIDISFASISDKDKDPERFGKVLVRKTAYTMPDGRKILQDTDDSAADFILRPANR